MSSSLPPRLMGGLMIEQEIAALLHGASDDELGEALAEARADETWTGNHLAAEVARRRPES